MQFFQFTQRAKGTTFWNFRQGFDWRSLRLSEVFRMKKYFLRYWFAVVLLSFSSMSMSSEGAVLVNGLAGPVYRLVNGEKKAALLFAVLRGEENFYLDKDARLSLLFEKSGRQETWTGSGHLMLRDGKSNTQDLPMPAVKMLDRKVARQLFRGPQSLVDGEVKVPRTRSLGTPEALARLENDYRRMRMEASAGDLNPEMYRLSALFEMREKERLEQAIRELPGLYPGNMEASLLASLYRKSMKGAAF